VKSTGIRSMVSLLVAAWIATLAGCAQWSHLNPLPEDIAPKRRQRLAETVQHFEQQRGMAEYEAAVACWKQNDTERCREYLDRLLRRYPNHRQGQLLAAQVDLLQGDWEAAHRQLVRLADDTPGDDTPGGETRDADKALIQHSLAVALDGAGQPAEALVHYRQAVEIEPQNELFCVSYDQAVAPPQVPEEAHSSAQESQAGRSLSPGVAGNSSCEEADRRFWDDLGPAARPLRDGAIALGRGDLDTAKARFLEGTSTQPDNPHVPIASAVLALRHNHPEVAIFMLRGAVLTFPNSATTHRILGMAYYRMGDFAASQLELQQALSLDKACALTYFLLGRTLSKLGQREAADGYLLQAEQLDRRFAPTS